MLLSSMSCAQNSPSENVSFRLHQPLQVTCQFEGINLIYNNRRIKVIINNSNKKKIMKIKTENAKMSYLARETPAILSKTSQFWTRDLRLRFQCTMGYSTSVKQLVSILHFSFSLSSIHGTFLCEDSHKIKTG